MLIRFDNPHTGTGGAVHHRVKAHLKPAVVAGKLPLLHIPALTAAAGDAKTDLGELVGLSVIEQHIFRGCGGVSKPVTQVEAEGHPLHQAGGGGPVPGVVVGPYAPAPIQHCKGVGGVQHVLLLPHRHLARSPQTVDLLVKIEVAGLVKGGADDHGLLRLMGEDDVRVQCIPAVKALHVGVELPLILLPPEQQGVAMAAGGAVPLQRGGGHPG